MASAVVWFEIYVSNIDRSIAFYSTLAGWQFGPLEGMPSDSYREIKNSPDGSVGGALVAGFPDRVGSGGIIIYVQVEDLDLAAGRAIAAGGTRRADSQLINAVDGKFALVSDPDGNLLGLWSR